VCLFGGMFEALAEKQPLVVVGTPGRLADLMR
jgi:superfamily II DNA/RNA helicase